jgi:hypothetical protein
MACPLKSTEKYNDPHQRSSYDKMMMERYNPNANPGANAMQYHSPPWPGQRTSFDAKQQQSCGNPGNTAGAGNCGNRTVEGYVGPRTKFDIDMQKHWGTTREGFCNSSQGMRVYGFDDNDNKYSYGSRLT